MKVEEPLRNAGNGVTASMTIKQYFSTHRNSTARECCRVLGLDYQRYGGRARKIKHDLNRWRQSITPVTYQYGRPPKPLVSVHRMEWRFRESVPASFIVALGQKAQAGRAEGIWYRSPNRNKQLEYSDAQVSIRVHQNGTCRILPRRCMTFDDFRAFIEDAFSKSLPARDILSDSFTRMMNGLQVSRRHRSFRVGQITPFKLDFYHSSLGLDILADTSHPEYLEIHENWPSWIPVLMEFQRVQNSAIESNTRVLSEFTAQIKSHLDVLSGIVTVVGRLSEATEALGQLIDSRLNSNCCKPRAKIQEE